MLPPDETFGAYARITTSTSGRKFSGGQTDRCFTPAHRYGRDQRDEAIIAQRPSSSANPRSELNSSYLLTYLLTYYDESPETTSIVADICGGTSLFAVVPHTRAVMRGLSSVAEFWLYGVLECKLERIFAEKLRTLQFIISR